MIIIMKKEISFQEKREEILQALKKTNFQDAWIFEELALVDGIAYHSLSDSISGGIVIGGKSIPMVVLVWKKTGKLYFFALKSLLPNLDV